MVGLDNPIHLAFLLLIVLLIFGAKRLPEIGRSLGSGLRGFKEAISGENNTALRVEPASEPAPELPSAVELPSDESSAVHRESEQRAAA